MSFSWLYYLQYEIIELNIKMEKMKQESNKIQEDWNVLVFNRTEEECKGKNLINWRGETRTILTKIKSSLVDEIKAMAKIPELMQKTIDAYLIALGYRTEKERKQTMKDFKERKLDLLKAAKTVKPTDLTFNDCSKIQKLVAGFDNDKVGKVSNVCKDFLRWTTNMVQLRIAEERYPNAFKESASSLKHGKKEKVSKDPKQGITSTDPKEEKKGINKKSTNNAKKVTATDEEEKKKVFFNNIFKDLLVISEI